MTPSIPRQIFISYSRRDALVFVTRLARDLFEKSGYRVFFDMTSIPPSAQFDEELEKGILDSAFFIAVLTWGSLERKSVCRQEIAFAIDNGRDVIPAQISGDPGLKPPILCYTNQWVDFASSYENGLQALLHYLNGDDELLRKPELELVMGIPPLHFKHDIARSMRLFVPRPWLDGAIRKWADSRSGALLITGSPGSGKSVVAASLCDGYPVAAAYFCRHSRSLNPYEFVASLAAQLREGVQEFAQALPLCHPRVRRESASDAFRALIIEPALAVRHSPDAKIIVVDGLDEALAYPGPESIVGVLVGNLAEGPPWLRFVLTSQPHPTVLGSLGHLPSISLNDHPLESAIDVKSYLRSRSVASEDAVGLLAEIAEGNFLVARLVADSIDQEKAPIEEIGRLVPGVSSFYYHLFSRRFPNVEAYRRDVAPLLEILIATRAPIPGDALRSAAGLPSVEMGLGRILPYLRIHSTPTGKLYELFHRSILDWLVEPEVAQQFAISATKGHAALAAYGLNEYAKHPADLPEYLRDHLAWHLARSERWDDLDALMGQDGLDLLGSWIDRGRLDEGLFCLPGLIAHVQRRDRVRGAGLMTQLARVQMRRGNYEEAESCLQRVMKEVSFWRGRRERAIAQHEMGSLSLYRQAYTEAGEFFRRALRNCRWGLPRYEDEEAANLLGLGAVEQENSRFRKALNLAERAQRLSRRSRDVPHMLAAYRLRALSLRGLGDYGQACETISRAVDEARRASAEHELPRLLMVKGWLEYDMAVIDNRDVAQALTSFREAVEGADSTGNYYILGEAKLSIAWCTVVGGEGFGKATDVDAFLRFTLPSGRHLGLWCGKAVLEVVNSWRSGDAAAGEKYQAAIRFCEANDNVAWRVRALVGLGSALYHAGGDGGEADRNWAMAVEVARQGARGLEQVTEAAISACRLSAACPPR